MNKSISNIFQRVKSQVNALIGYIKEHLTWGWLVIIIAALLFGGQLTTMMIEITHRGDPTFDHYRMSSFMHMICAQILILGSIIIPDSIKYKKVFNG